tara:strand:- start:180 stop:713 length:534 start_codon:yes stop_codon:yes gene_type:complete
MKNYLFLLLFVCLTVSQSFAQNSKGYIGVSLGLASPMGDTADGVDSGLELGLINAGYRFNEKWGMTLNWGASGHQLTEDDDITAGIGYIGIGPMYSYKGFDFKAQYAFVTAVIEDSFNDTTEDFDADSGFILGVSYNYPLSDKWGLIGNADYLTFTMEDADESDSIFKLSVGIRYNF